MNSKAQKTKENEYTFPIVGIGCSAGGLDALKLLLGNLPVDLGMAMVVIQHLDPSHVSRTAEILTKFSRYPVSEALDGMRVEVNHVYVITEDSYLTLNKGYLKTSPRGDGHHQKMPINMFFNSLADELGSMSVGVILSGAANDGAIGIQSIKKAGGVTIAQRPSTAQYASMPENAISTGMADYILGPAEAAKELALIHLLLEEHVIDSVFDKENPKHKEAFGKILKMIEEDQRCDFSQYKESSVARRISRRIAILRLKSILEYDLFLKSHPEEIRKLSAEILIHVTSFFRDPSAFEKLKKDIFPKIISSKAEGETVRIWVPGCSTGEEVYSLIMIFYEVLKERNIQLKVIASDISSSSLQKAREGHYPQSIENNVSKERLKRFFNETENGYTVKKSLREVCLFSRHDCTYDPPFAKMDLISCRNMLIYFSGSLQRYAMKVFHYALNDSGFLFLGNAESIGESKDFFSPIDEKMKIYQKIKTNKRGALNFSDYRRIPTDGINPANFKMLNPNKRSLHEEVQKLGLREFVPANIVVNKSMEILETNGDTSPFIEMAKGAASLNLYKMIKPEFLSDLRMLMKDVLDSNRMTKRHGLIIGSGKSKKQFHLKVIPFRLSEADEPTYSIYFEEKEVPSAGPVQFGAPLADDQKIIEELQMRLSENLEYQEKLVEDYEASQTELLVSNEELQSSNEELQSMNEELETVQEELQSTNDELVGVNREIENQYSEITKKSETMNNLVSSIDVAIIMVDKNHNIRQITPRAETLFKLRESDYGQPIDEIRLGFQEPKLNLLLAQVVDGGEGGQVELKNSNGIWYMLRMRPFLKENLTVDGAVITFIDINEVKCRSEEIEKNWADYISILNKMPIPLIVFKDDFLIKMVNETFCIEFQIDKESCVGRSILDFSEQLWGNTKLESLIKNSIKDDYTRSEFIQIIKPTKDCERLIKFSLENIDLTGSGEKVSALAVEDITKQYETEKALRDSEEKFRSTLTRVHNGILLLNGKGKIEFVNDLFVKMFGYTVDELRFEDFEILLFPEQKLEFGRFLRGLIKNPRRMKLGRNEKIYGRHKDGRKVMVDVSLDPFKSGEHTFLTCIVHDLTEVNRAAEEVQNRIERNKILREQAEMALQVKDNFLASVSHELLTPLSTILTWSQMLNAGKVTPEKLGEVYSSIELSARIQKQLIDDLLETSQIQSGKFLLNLSEINLIETLEKSIDSIRNLADSKSINIHFEKEPCTEHISADSIRLNQVFWNILKNAIKFTDPGGDIYVSVSEVDGHLGRALYIQFRDTGKGIEKEFLPNIFKHFTQEDRQITRNYGGLGLGMSIVQNLVCMHGGWVDVTSPGAGEGTTFSVTLPIITGSTVNFKEAFNHERFESKRGVKNHFHLDGKRVLIFDADETSGGYFQLMLKGLGAEAQEVPVDEVDQSKFIKMNYDLILICDKLVTPERLEENYLLVNRIKSSELLKNIPILFLTGKSTNNEIEDMFKHGIDARLSIPVEAVTLAKTVRILCSEAK